MTNLTERVAKVIAEATYQRMLNNIVTCESIAQAALTEIFNYLENPSEAAVAAGKQYVRAEDDAMGWAWEAMLAQFKEEALGK